MVELYKVVSIYCIYMQMTLRSIHLYSPTEFETLNYWKQLISTERLALDT